ncbi:MAG TPA: hypothetical protein VME40_13975 [Caulobacteraceae bacterium]|nr:hypothetical protein [Caulobacteraceae bacterium]
MEYRADVICCGAEGRLCRVHGGTDDDWYFAITRDPIHRRRFATRDEAWNYWSAIRGQDAQASVRSSRGSDVVA